MKWERKRQSLTYTHIERSGSGSWIRLIDQKVGQSSLLHKEVEPTGSPMAASSDQALPSTHSQRPTGHTPSSCTPFFHALLLSPLTHPPSPSLPCLPACLPVSRKPFRAYLTKQHTLHKLPISPLLAQALSLNEKTEILRLAAAAMSHDLILAFPPTSHSSSLTPPLPPLSTYNSSAICR